jgi:hypothetical protein
MGVNQSKKDDIALALIGVRYPTRELAISKLPLLFWAHGSATLRS